MQVKDFSQLAKILQQKREEQDKQKEQGSVTSSADMVPAGFKVGHGQRSVVIKWSTGSTNNWRCRTYEERKILWATLQYKASEILWAKTT